MQKQPPDVFCKKNPLLEISNIHRKTPVPESLFNKVVNLRSATLLKNKIDPGTGVFR